MYYADLSPYVYFTDESEATNIGWLDKQQPFPQGATPDGFIEILRILAGNPIRQTRGFHKYPFCGNEKGSSEIRVTAQDGKVYAAPILVIHYIEAHAYLPPREFVKA